MYHGDNKTAQLSQQLIADATIRLLETNAYSDINVSMICREAQVSRQTFYTLFGSKENVLIYLLRSSCCYEPEQKKAVCRSADFRCFCQGYSSYIIEKRNILELLVKNDMMHCLYDVQYKALMESSFIGEVTGDYRVFLVDFLVSGMNSIAGNYVQTGCSFDEDTLSCLMVNLFSGNFFMGR